MKPTTPPSPCDHPITLLLPAYTTATNSSTSEVRLLVPWLDGSPALGLDPLPMCYSKAQLDQRTAADPSEPDVAPNSSSSDLPAEDAASLSARYAELEASLAAAQQQIRQLQQEAATSASSLADLQAQNASLTAANADWAARLEEQLEAAHKAQREWGVRCMRPGGSWRAW
jgi:septal ring factor EnvC (AmiA/AmiB activator)